MYHRENKRRISIGMLASIPILIKRPFSFSPKSLADRISTKDRVHGKLKVLTR